MANWVQLIKEAAGQGKMVLMSTHILADSVQAVSRYAVLNNGKIQTAGTLAEIRMHYGLKETDSFDQIYQILSQEQQNA